MVGYNIDFLLFSLGNSEFWCWCPEPKFQKTIKNTRKNTSFSRHFEMFDVTGSAGSSKIV
jgi:hypothetical protein